MTNLKNINQQGKQLFKQQSDELQTVINGALNSVGQSVQSALSTMKGIRNDYKTINKTLGYLLPITVIMPIEDERERPRPTL
jgi:hypothetical protein